MESTRSGGFNFNLADLSRKYTFKRDIGWLQECQGERETSLEVRLPRTMLQFKPLVSVSKQHCPALDTTALDCDHQNIHHLPLPLSPGTVVCSPHWFASLWPISFYNIPQGTEALWGFFLISFYLHKILTLSTKLCTKDDKGSKILEEKDTIENKSWSRGGFL